MLLRVVDISLVPSGIAVLIMPLIPIAMAVINSVGLFKEHSKCVAAAGRMGNMNNTGNLHV